MKSKVYKALTVITNRTRGDKGISISELAKAKEVDGMSEAEVLKVVEVLSDDAKIHFDEKSGKVYL